MAPGVRLSSKVRIAMEGKIKLKTWTPFKARQILRVGEGFVWRATGGSGPLRFVGGDTLWNGKADLDFKMWGMIPVAHESGPDIDRSAVGRLAAETVAWAPQALTPQMGATWTSIDGSKATVTLPVLGEDVDVTVTIADDGRLRELVTQRWGDPEQDEFGFHPFGASVLELADVDGITIVSDGRVGWWWGTDRQAEGEFFRFSINDTRVVGHPEEPVS